MLAANETKKEKGKNELEDWRMRWEEQCEENGKLRGTAYFQNMHE